MKKETVITAKTVEDAVSQGAKELGAAVSAVTYEVLEQPKKGFLGFGAAPAKVKVVYEAPDPKPVVNDPKPERTEAKPQNQNRPPKAPKAQKPKEEKPEKADEEVEAVEIAPKTPKTELNKAEEMAVAFLEKLISDMEITAKVEVFEGDDDDTVLSVTGENAGILIGHHGDTLDALQYLASLAANRREEDETEGRSYQKITVDVENYRAKREATLRTLARRMAAKALKYQKNVTLEPMNPYERRIIHSEVQNIEGVSTNSVGTDNNRRIVIYLTGTAKPTEADVLSEQRDRRNSRGGRNGGRRQGPRPETKPMTEGEETENAEIAEGESFERSDRRDDRRGGRGRYDRRDDRRGGRGGRGGRPERDPNRPRQAHPVMVEAPDGTPVENTTPAVPETPAEEKSAPKKPYYMKPKSSTISRPYQKPVKKDSVESYYFDLENSSTGLTREKEEPSDIAKACGIYEGEPEEQKNN